mmetsp:Transcript_62087/g.201289  ORF Transcript_62087/g.201289 Transcript_62087/m.201289 type:complete len:343 (+) Transcript_62087:1-1029(+)
MNLPRSPSAPCCPETRLLTPLGIPRAGRRRRFVRAEIAEDELVLFVDAFDVVLFGGRAEIVQRFEELERQQNRSLFFNCEKVCFPNFDDICTADYPASPHPQWRYLNSGAFIGRGAALKQMLKDPVDDVMPGSDQAFYQRYFRYFPERVGVDHECKLLCATQGIGESWGIELHGSRLENRITGTVPSVVHFVSNAHWAQWKDGVPTTDLNDVFQLLHPVAGERLFGVVDVGIRVGGSHHSKILSLRSVSREAYHSLMHAVLCIQCRVFGSTDRECSYAPSFGCDMCTEVRIVVEAAMLLFSIALFVRRGWGSQLCRLTAGLCLNDRGLRKVAEMFSKTEKAV